MPNYVRNRLVIIGEETTIRPMLEAICNPETGGIDFERINPMPEELHGVTSPVRIISEAEFQKEKREREARLILGNSDNMFERYSLTKKLQEEYIEKFGADNWYDWSCQNWGTKWNACSAEPPVVEEEEGMTKATLVFETAWSCPVPIIEKLSNTYPDVLINIKYADEDFGSNVGEGSIKSGVWIYENVPDGCTNESYEMAMEMWPDMSEYYEKDDEGNWKYKEDEE